MRGLRRRTLALALFALTSLSGGTLRVSPPEPSPPPSSPVEVGAEAAAVAGSLAHLHTGLVPEEIGELAGVIVAESHRAGLSPAFVLAMIQVESSGDNFAMSPVGALGLMQLLPATGEAMALEIGVPWRGPATLFDPVDNVRLGIHYLERLVRRWGSLPMALEAYNWGPTRIGRMLRRGGPIPSAYSARVLATYGRPAATALRPT